MVEKSVIIAAGGLGKRMNADMPKQFLLLNNRPIIIHTIERFLAIYPNIEVIVVLNNTLFEDWKNIANTYNFTHEVKVVEGGDQRFHSIQNGLKVAEGKLIAVHDAARPLVSREIIECAFEQAEVTGAAIPVIRIGSSLRQITFDDSQAVNRDNYRLVQTPQVFKSTVIKLAYEQNYRADFTDDATVVEYAGHEIALVEGNRQNIKITEQIDLKIAEELLKSEN